ncbi:MAG: phospholipase D family protein [Alphaproteobacteria bacterium]|nr:phospholipase D family protein [Alphaproteobacteria bacterium]NCQ66390.1 phospholipase D family protein [Alphaproteobacteria bacterium]NCT06875.1 phospholipase D family protein [Alphaproteobacteria bacterium]
MTAKKIHRKSATSTLGIMPLLFLFGFTSGYFYYEGQLPTVFSSETESPTLNVCFSPEGQCEKLAVHAIKTAKQEILVQAYSFTSLPISDALIEAHRKGITVKILFDRSQLKAPYSQIHRLTKAGIKTKVDDVQGIAHNKTIIVDGARLITGSYNFSNAANVRNSENMLYINDKSLAAIYKDKWQERFKIYR